MRINVWVIRKNDLAEISAIWGPYIAIRKSKNAKKWPKKQGNNRPKLKNKVKIGQNWKFKKSKISTFLKKFGRTPSLWTSSVWFIESGSNPRPQIESLLSKLSIETRFMFLSRLVAKLWDREAHDIYIYVISLNNYAGSL